MTNKITLPSGLVILLLLASLPAQVFASRQWHFDVYLDDKPIGFHRFTLRGDHDDRQIESVARFRVKVLGLTVYDYSHRSLERWQDDCLRSLDASTNDNGELHAVRGDINGDALVLRTGTGPDRLPGCVMTFAYWNPAMLEQQRLLNVQTGEYLDVDIDYLGGQVLQVAGDTIEADHYRIRAGERDIELWYTRDRDWLALSSTTSSGRLLRYVKSKAADDFQEVMR